MFGIDADSQAAADLEGAALNDEVGVNSAHDAFGHDGGFGFVTDGAQHDIGCSSEKESTGHDHHWSEPGGLNGSIPGKGQKWAAAEGCAFDAERGELQQQFVE